MTMKTLKLIIFSQMSSKFRLMNKSAGAVSIISHNQMLLTSLLANITLGTMYGRHLPSTAVTDSSVSLSFEICTACITCDCGFSL